jgi:hypothetical protein
MSIWKHDGSPPSQAMLDEVVRSMRRSRNASSGVRIDYSKWSDEARTSPVAFLDEFYSHLPYNCRACGRDCVFSAEDQKHVLEVLKKRVGWGPSLCDGCYAVRVGLERERRRFEAAWCESRGNLRKSARDLGRWLEVLEALPRYGPKKDAAKIKHLKKLLQSSEAGRQLVPGDTGLCGDPREFDAS